MQTALYVSLSGQIAAEKRLTSVANNVANMTTAGFRAEQVRFEEVLANAGADAVSFAGAGDTYLSRAQGALQKTGGDLDLAVQGDAWFAVLTPAGMAFTRDGRFRATADGALVTLSGYPVLDSGGGRVAIDPAAGPVTVGRDGAVSQNNAQVGVIGLYELPAAGRLRRHGDNAVLSDLPAVPVQNFASVGVMQGYVEGSNVNPMHELTRLITLQRQFDSATTTTREMEEAAKEGIRSLGPST